SDRRGIGDQASFAVDPKNEGPYRGNVHSLWRGRALAIIQPTGETGPITVRAQADGLDDDTLRVELF
ncbi:hypothetical protein ACFL34_05180, partial [Candidatus Sumerlaeota bacterium]